MAATTTVVGATLSGSETTAEIDAEIAGANATAPIGWFNKFVKKSLGLVAAEPAEAGEDAAAADAELGSTRSAGGVGLWTGSANVAVDVDGGGGGGGGDGDGDGDDTVKVGTRGAVDEEDGST